MEAVLSLLFPLLLVWAALEYRHSLLRAKGRPGAAVEDRGTLRVLLGVIVPSVLLAFAASRLLPPRFPGAVGLLGLALMVAGISLREWAVKTLGTFFTVDVAVQEGHRVVAHGPYAFVRHPSYAGALLTMLGAGLAFGNWLSLALALLPGLLLLLWRIRVEEEVLVKRLGEEYRGYVRRTKRLVPFLY